MYFTRKLILDLETTRIFLFQEVLPANRLEEEDGMPMSSSVTDDVSADEICILSSEGIVIEDSVGDDAAETEQRSTYL